MAIIAWPATVGGLDNARKYTEIVFVGGFDVLAIQEVEPPSFIVGESRYEERLRLEREEAERMAQLRARVSGVPTGAIPDLIRDRAAAYGIDATIPLAIARCESGFNPQAKNKHSTASGVFQYLAGTWTNTPEGKAGQSVFDAEANVEAAVRHIATHGTSPWNASKHCWAR